MSLLAVGFFGEGNLGDAAILEGIRQSLPRSFRLSATAGLEPVPAGVVRTRRKGLAAWPVFLSEARQADRIVFAGGILQDWSMDGVLFFALRLLAAELLGRPAELWGAGLGPLRRAPLRRIATRSLRRVTTAWLRDQPSVDLFQDLTGRSARLGTDWSWGLAATPANSAPDADGAVGINLRPWSDPTWEMAVPAVATTHGPTIGIAARAEDARLCQRLMPDRPCFQPERFGELLTFCGRLREGWAMRYHVLLAMLRAGLPTVALPYDDKVASLAREAGLRVPGGRGGPPTGLLPADPKSPPGNSSEWHTAEAKIDPPAGPSQHSPGGVPPMRTPMGGVHPKHSPGGVPPKRSPREGDLPVARCATADFLVRHSTRWREMSTAFVSCQEAL
jgi:hypothetical protein